MKITQGFRLDALGLALVLLEVSGLDWCWLRRFLESLLYVIYRKCASMTCQHGCNVWGGAKMVYYMLMHDLTILAFRAIY
jgi:hypothetical protein